LHALSLGGVSCLKARPKHSPAR